MMAQTNRIQCPDPTSYNTMNEGQKHWNQEWILKFFSGRKPLKRLIQQSRLKLVLKQCYFHELYSIILVEVFLFRPLLSTHGNTRAVVKHPTLQQKVNLRSLKNVAIKLLNTMSLAAYCRCFTLWLRQIRSRVDYTYTPFRICGWTYW